MPLRPVALFLVTLTLVGCAAQTWQPAHPCAGKATVAEAVETLNFRRDKTRPIRASGQCLLKYRVEGRRHKDNFPVKLWVNPPDEVCLQGDVAFDAAGLMLGSNADEFWFWLKPKEVSTYWWGSWSQAGLWNRLALSPAVVLEAFGGVNVQDGGWSLTRIGDFDVLVLNSEQGDILKRVYVEPCNYVVSKIEHLDSAGRIAVSAEFTNYKQIAEGFLVPAMIRIIAVANDGLENSAEISLVSVQQTQLNDQQRQRLFVRPPPRGFDHVYKTIDGAVVEQTVGE
jgi:hypothetical protein